MASAAEPEEASGEDEVIQRQLDKDKECVDSSVTGPDSITNIVDMKPKHVAHIKKNIAKGGVCVNCSKPLPDDNIEIVLKIKSTKEILNIVICVSCSPPNKAVWCDMSV
mmetsp:Transcript_42509/g.85960  ORF Transcript_42509/g.85960 Transcript_42509/m.85960 type:complete len:109 (-) Transcript_42509:187-513(-)